MTQELHEAIEICRKKLDVILLSVRNVALLNRNNVERAEACWLKSDHDSQCFQRIKVGYKRSERSGTIFRTRQMIREPKKWKLNEAVKEVVISSQGCSTFMGCMILYT